MTNKQVLRVFEVYQKERLSFAQSLSDMGGRPGCVQSILSLGGIDLLIPLLNDTSVKIQQCAANALGRMARTAPNAGFAIAKKRVLPSLLKSIDKKTKYYKKSAMEAVAGVVKNSAELASVIVAEGCLDAVMSCLVDFEPSVKEAAGYAISAIASHSHYLSQATITAGAVPLLKMCLQEPEIFLKHTACLALSEISKHGLENAQAVVDSMAIPYMVKCLADNDPRLKKQALCCLANVAKHSLNLAEIVIEAEVFPDTLIHLGHPDPQVVRAAANLTKEVVKHHTQLAQLVVSSGGLAPLILLVTNKEGNLRLPAAMCLGYIAAQSSPSSSAIIAGRGVEELKVALANEKAEHIKCAQIWALGQIGKHSPEHTKALALAGVFPLFLENYLDEKSSGDLKLKCRGACKQVLTRCMNLPSLEPLLPIAPPEILKYILGQFTKQLPHDPVARRLFITSGNLKRLQEIKVEPGSTLMECINVIKKCFPEEIIRYYSPGYSDELLQQVENFIPQIPSLFKCPGSEDVEETDLMVTINEPPFIPQFDGCN